MRRLRTGVLGCGLIAQVMHLPYLRELAERFEVTALCDLSPNARAAAGSLFPDTASSNARPTSSASRSTSLWCSRPAATPRSPSPRWRPVCTYSSRSRSDQLGKRRLMRDHDSASVVIQAVAAIRTALVRDVLNCTRVRSQALGCGHLPAST